MAAPDFSKTTIEVLVKRAGYLCSNPDCRISTVGPNPDQNKATAIGEAAHIYGARSGSKRYKEQMADIARAEVTNGIWLCRNCHKLIDSDEETYSSELLFNWREVHEEYVFEKLGQKADAIRYRLDLDAARKFDDLPPYIHRIMIDKPEAWEWRLTAELLRYFSGPVLEKYDDLKSGMYTQALSHISEERLIEWLGEQIDEIQVLVPPLVKILDRLTKSWGEPGESGDINEIVKCCRLLAAACQRILQFEERQYFTKIPEKAIPLHELMKNALGDQMKQFSELPEFFDEFALIAIENEHSGTEDETLVVRKTIMFELPHGWEQQFNKELTRLSRYL